MIIPGCQKVYRLYSSVLPVNSTSVSAKNSGGGKGWGNSLSSEKWALYPDPVTHCTFFPT